MCRHPVPAPFMSLPKQKPKYCNLISFLYAQFRDFYLCLLAPAVVPLHEAMAHATDAPLVGRHGISKVSGASHAGSVDGINSDSPGAPSQPNDVCYLDYQSIHPRGIPLSLDPKITPGSTVEAGAPAELRRRGTVALDPDESFGFGVWHGAETVRDAHSEGTETHETRRRRTRSRGALRVPDASFNSCAGSREIPGPRAWDGLGWDGLGWDGLGWDGLGWDGLGWDGLISLVSWVRTAYSSKWTETAWCLDDHVADILNSLWIPSLIKLHLHLDIAKTITSRVAKRPRNVVNLFRRCRLKLGMHSYSRHSRASVPGHVYTESTLLDKLETLQQISRLTSPPSLGSAAEDPSVLVVVAPVSAAHARNRLLLAVGSMIRRRPTLASHWSPHQTNGAWF
ncbi:hypothetical protein NM208_g13594 [Fusarium decemcellulare]|uniref:Uncharacterized protein n=1 Tax=Fusarium decemcellulare TaxID=57161 RepID=A0ACC1RJ92_9HYPO|nr:hypothetical protein NM208_g13594 [Fusarium decemcellulare]